MSLTKLARESYAKLGVTPEQVRDSPQITPQLRVIAATLRRYGQPTVTTRIVNTNRPRTPDAATLEETVKHHAPYSPGSDLVASWPLYLTASDDPEIRKLLEVRRKFPHFGNNSFTKLPIEAYCLAAGVSPLRVLEVLVGIIVRQGAQASTIIAAINHPRVVQKTVEMALTDGGIEDRTTLHKAVNFLPTPKGNTTIINNAPSASASASAHAAAASAPPPEQTIRRLSDRFNEARLQNAQPVAALPEASVDAPAIPVPAARFGDAPARFAVPSAIRSPSRITEPAPAAAEFADAEDDE